MSASYDDLSDKVQSQAAEIVLLKNISDGWKNQTELLSEDIESVHMWLDSHCLDRSLGDNTYSIVGRIGLLIDALKCSEECMRGRNETSMDNVEA